MHSEILLALAERAEQASGPDRELDAEIKRILAVGPEWSRATPEARKVWARRYTASLDAAKSLWPGEVPHLIPSDPRICTAMALRARAATIPAVDGRG